MERKWGKSPWLPTMSQEQSPVVFQSPSPAEIRQYAADLRLFTKQIHRLPYDPQTWISRSVRLHQLGYPELALGDVYKAKLLIDAALKNDDWLGGSVLLTTGMSLWVAGIQDPVFAVLDRNEDYFRISVRKKLRELEEDLTKGLVAGLFCAAAFADAAHFSREAMRHYPQNLTHSENLHTALIWYKRKAALRDKNEYKDIADGQFRHALRSGSINTRPYPWISGSLLTRDEQVLKAIQREFLVLSQKCTVMQSRIRNHMEDNSQIGKNEVYGVFASQNIGKGDTILIDDGIASVTNCPKRCSTCCSSLPPNPAVLSCCGTQFCTAKCAVRAFKEYHQPLCRKDLSFLYAEAHGAHERSSHLSNLLLLRIIAMSIQEGVPNPLKSSLMARLTPQYSGKTPFYFVEDIVNPIRILQALGIDIFADLNYDTWVLQTIRHRVDNNQYSDTIDGEFILNSCLPAYSMFNHSCEPNVEYNRQGSGGYMRMFAKRKNRKGEELFISYKNVENATKAERKEMVMPWLGGPCKCTRCEKER